MRELVIKNRTTGQITMRIDVTNFSERVIEDLTARFLRNMNIDEWGVYDNGGDQDV